MFMAGAITLFFLLFPLFGSYALISPDSSNVTADELALLAFKAMFPSKGSLASWNSSSHYCSWPGVICSRRHPDRVASLTISSSSLSGQLSPFLGNLSFLKVLDLHDNNLVGEIPPELGHLSRLRVLNLSTNSLQGAIPEALVGCSNLTILHLSDNRLQGQFPTWIGSSLKNLVLLNVEKNGFSGAIPPSLAALPLLEQLILRVNRFSGEVPLALGNLSNLGYLALDYNMLSGAIPSSLGQLSSLFRLTLAFNNFTGLIPTSIWNVSSLESFTVQQNYLTGSFPPYAFNALPNLQMIGTDHNNFHGSIPASIVNASDLWIVQIGANPLSGIIPPEIGGLKKLKYLLLSDTLLEAKEPNDWKFITALTNCSRLSVLTLSGCNFSGVLPDSLSNLSTSMTQLYLDTNEISGGIPKYIDNLINVQGLGLNNNYFTDLPSSIGRLQHLQSLSVANNEIGGPIPWTLGNLTELNILNLESNTFSGNIPSIIGNLTSLLSLNLARNNFTGQIPRQLFNISTLSKGLDISNNNLEGSIPLEIGNLKSIIVFHAESNKLSGEIPTSIGECQFLQNLYLQNNFITGGIPLALGQLEGIEILDLSNNKLSGPIPKFLGNLTLLYSLNLSFNNFVGELPTVGVFGNASGVSIQGNAKLCGGIWYLHLPPCSLESPNKRHNHVVAPVVISLVATAIILSSFFILLTWCKRSKTKTTLSVTLKQSHPLISYSQLVKATEGFSPTRLLGSGSFGSVYKGELDDQDGETTNLVAVKVLKLQTPGALKSFVAECEALRNMRHRNLVKIVTACASIDSRGNDFKAIVYDFMPNGSLEGWLHPDANEQPEQRYLDLAQRVTILLDVAYALDYLHCNGPAPVIHCDLKSSNVLLDVDMVAHVGDFGLAKIIIEGGSTVQQSMSSMGLRGTIGYAAPEYGAGNPVSIKGDIYSYGILVLETVTGKRPTDSTFEQGLSLHEYVKLALQNGTMDIIETCVSLSLKNELQDVGNADSSHKTNIGCLIALLRLGLSCSEELPSSRMPTGDIIKELLAIKGCLLQGMQKMNMAETTTIGADVFIDTSTLDGSS